MVRSGERWSRSMESDGQSETDDPVVLQQLHQTVLNMWRFSPDDNIIII